MFGKLFGKMNANVVIKRLSSIEIQAGQSSEPRWNEYYQLLHSHRLTAEAKKRGLCFAYYSGGINAGWHAKEYFGKFSKCYFWLAEQLAAYARMPRMVTLYRGVSIYEVLDAGITDDEREILHPERLGISWTPHISTAFKYAIVEDGKKIEDIVKVKQLERMGFILSTKINKRRIKVLYPNVSGECVIVPQKGDKVTTEQPVTDVVDFLEGMRDNPLVEKGREFFGKIFFHIMVNNF